MHRNVLLSCFSEMLKWRERERQRQRGKKINGKKKEKHFNMDMYLEFLGGTDTSG